VPDPFIVIWDENIVDPQNLYNETTGKYYTDSAGNYVIDISIDCQAIIAGLKEVYVALYLGDDIIESYTVDVSGLPFPNQYINAHRYVHLVAAADVGKPFYMVFAYKNNLGELVQSTINHSTIDIFNRTTPSVNVFKNTISDKNHMPNMLVKDFLNAFYTIYQIMPFFNHKNKTVELTFLRDIISNREYDQLENGLIKDSLKVYPNTFNGITLKFDFQGPDELLNNNFVIPETVTNTIETYDLLPATPVLGQIYYIESLNAYYEYQYFAGATEADPGTYAWAAKCDHHVDYVVDAGEEIITNTMAPLLMRYNKLEDKGRNLPSIEAPGTSEGFGMINDFPLRTMFYVGLTSCIPYGAILSDLYPTATTTSMDTNGNIVTETNYRIDWLVLRYWTNIIYWFQRRMRVEFTHLVSPQFINTINMQRRNLLMNTTIFVDEVVVKIKNKLFGPGDFTGWTG
jgi:hypothetical protein